MELFDNHCHLEELCRKGCLEVEISAARKAGITGWLSSALSAEEYRWHKKQDIPGMKWCAGIHPFYEKSSEKDFPLLVSLCENQEICAIGEVGLDSRNPALEWQKKILLQQLDLAKQFKLPVIFHTVKMYYELIKLLKNNFPEVKGWLHGFNGSMEIMHSFAIFDLGFSLNARLPKTPVLKAIIKEKKWRIETDAPYAKPPFVKKESNSLKNLIWVRDEIQRRITV